MGTVGLVVLIGVCVDSIFLSSMVELCRGIWGIQEEGLKRL